MLAPGTYVLTRDVDNPKPDRRHKYDWRALSTIPAGTEFLAVEWTWEIWDLEPDIQARLQLKGPHTEIVMVGGRWSHHKVRDHGQYQALYAALEAALVPVQESTSAMLTRLDVQSQFGKWLLESGTIPRELFETLWARYMEGGTGIPLEVRP